MRRWQPSSVTSPEIDVTLRRPITHRQYDTGGGGVPAPAPRRDLCAAPQSESAPAAPRAWTGLLRDDVHTLNYTAVRPLDSLTLLHVCSLTCVCVCVEQQLNGSLQRTGAHSVARKFPLKPMEKTTRHVLQFSRPHTSGTCRFVFFLCVFCVGTKVCTAAVVRMWSMLM